MRQSTHSRTLWLEKENRHLLRTVEELQTKIDHQLERDRLACGPDASTSCKQSAFQHQQPCRGEFEEAPGPFIQGPDLQEGDTPRADHFKGLITELKDFQEDPDKLCCFVESRESRDLANQSTRSSYAMKQTQRLEAKCQALDTVNQHLQTALDNSGTVF